MNFVAHLSADIGFLLVIVILCSRRIYRNSMIMVRTNICGWKYDRPRSRDV